MRPPHKELSHNVIVANGLFTLTYVGVLLATLNHLDQLNKIGRFSSVYVVIILLTGDLIKSKFSETRQSRKGQIKRTILFSCGSVLFYSAIAILYGAPFLSEHEQTLMFGLILASLTTVHSLIHLGLKDTLDVLREPMSLSGQLTVAACTMRNLQFAVLFAWASTVVIPLDWNRPWQAWPIPCCVGAMVGYVVGNLVSVILIFGSKFRKHHRIKMRAV